MQFDIYRRPEPRQRLSYLAVPAGRPIPPEAVSTEWTLHARALDLDDSAPAFEEFGIQNPGGQWRDKGYAITDLAHQPAISSTGTP